MRPERNGVQSAAVLTGALCVIGLVPARALPRCPVKQLTGYDCPGCGLQRACRYAVRGHLAQAFSANALIFTLPVFLTALRVSERFARRRELQRWIVGLAVVTTVVFTLLRNRPSSRLAAS